MGIFADMTTRNRNMKNWMILMITAGLINAGCAFTQDIDTGKIELPALESTDYIVEYEGYTSSYNVLTQTPGSQCRSAY